MRSLPVLALLIIVVGVVVARAKARTKRQRELVRLCLDAGVSFAVVDPFPDTLFLPFRLFGRGHDRGIETVVWDPRDDGAIRAFDYWFEEQDAEGIGVKTDMTCAVIPLPFSAPPLTVLTRGAPDPSREPVDGTQIRLELETFNRRFDVWSVDARAAVAFLDQRMMQALLALPLRVTIHVHEDRMLCVASTLDPAGVLVLLEAARGLAHRVPPVVASLYPPRPGEGPYEDRWLQGSWSPDPTSARRAEPD